MSDYMKTSFYGTVFTTEEEYNVYLKGYNDGYDDEYYNNPYDKENQNNLYLTYDEGFADGEWNS